MDVILDRDMERADQETLVQYLTKGGLDTAKLVSDLLASTGWDGKLRLWDSRTGKQLFSTASGIIGTPPRFSPDDRLLSCDVRDGQHSGE